VALKNASDTDHREGSEWAAAKAIDGSAGDKSGWSVSSRRGKPEAAVFEVSRDVGSVAGTTLTFTLTQSTPNASLGKFRLSVTTAPRPVRALPVGVADVLTVAPQDRTAEHAAELTAYYRTFSPELQTIRDQVAQVNQQIAAMKPVTVPVMRELPAEKHRVTNVMI
jgi:hypothetical protein